jgi:hypothetical protein
MRTADWYINGGTLQYLDSLESTLVENLPGAPTWFVRVLAYFVDYTVLYMIV